MLRRSAATSLLALALLPAAAGAADTVGLGDQVVGLDRGSSCQSTESGSLCRDVPLQPPTGAPLTLRPGGVLRVTLDRAGLQGLTGRLDTGPGGRGTELAPAGAGELTLPAALPCADRLDTFGRFADGEGAYLGAVRVDGCPEPAGTAWELPLVPQDGERGDAALRLPVPGGRLLPKRSLRERFRTGGSCAITIQARGLLLAASSDPTVEAGGRRIGRGRRRVHPQSTGGSPLPGSPAARLQWEVRSTGTRLGAVVFVFRGKQVDAAGLIAPDTACGRKALRAAVSGARPVMSS